MNFRFRQPTIGQANHVFPSESTSLLVSTLKRVMPIFSNLKPKRIQRSLIRWGTKIAVVPSYSRAQLSANFRNGIVHPFSQFDFDFLQFHPQSLFDGSADNHKYPIALFFVRNVGKYKKVKTLRSSQTTFESVIDRKRSKFYQMRLFMKFQRKFSESHLQFSQKLFRYSPILKSNNEIISPAYDNDFCAFTLHPPLLNSQFVYYCITSLDFPTRFSSTVVLEEHGISRFSRKLLVHMYGISNRERSPEYSPDGTLDCRLLPFSTASAPPLFYLTRLDTQPPMHMIINASQTNLRMSVHDSCSVWTANPSLSRTFIRKLARQA